MKVLKIGAIWCPGCLVMKPRWAKIESENPWLETQYYEYDESKEVIEKYGLKKTTLPVFIFLDKEGNEIERINGEVSEKGILQKINDYKDK